MLDPQKERLFIEEIDELTSRFGLEEDGEHVIIPFTSADGRKKRVFLLKRRFIRIVYPEGYFLDIPLGAAIESTIENPELPLSEGIMITHKELIERKTKIIDDGITNETLSEPGNSTVQ